MFSKHSPDRPTFAVRLTLFRPLNPANKLFLFRGFLMPAANSTSSFAPPRAMPIPVAREHLEELTIENGMTLFDAVGAHVQNPSLQGGSASASYTPAPPRGEKHATAKTSAAVLKLKGIAERLEASAQARLSQNRLANTARRARMASSAEDAARADLALARTMINLAAALERGDAVHLHGLREKAQVEQLMGVIQSAHYKEANAGNLSYSDREAMRDAKPTVKTLVYVVYPTFRADETALRGICAALQGVRGAARLRRQIEDLKDRAVALQNHLPLKAELVEACFETLGKAAAKVVPWNWIEVRARLKRLSRMGLDTQEQLRAACREFLLYQEARPAEDRAVALERAFIGSKVGFNFFPTPTDLAGRMVEMAEIQPGECVLEPSAGDGNIAGAIRAAGVEPDVVEISGQLREILEAKRFNLVGWDFLDVTGEYDAIVMNPPFSGNADIAHVRHAYALLRDGGRLVSIVGEGAFFRMGKTEAEFREWLDELAAEVITLPAGTFTDTQLLATTGANARLVVIHK